jgi:formylmethanofuran dehydrogenase subunit B
MAAFIGKREAPLEAAIARASEMLVPCRMPLVTGLGADVAGMRSALRLAARLGGAVDFCRAKGSTHLLRALIDRGLMFTTPREARNRADVLMLVGPTVGRSDAIINILEGHPVLSAGDGAKRDVLWLCPANAADELSRFDMLVAEAQFIDIHGILAMLNAAIRSRPMQAEGFGGLYRQDYEEIAGRLITARYGVIAFSPEDLDALAIEALFAFAEQLSSATRVTLLPIITDAAAQTAALVSAWSTGLPPRLGFARGYPEFDFWRFDAERLSRSRECDALLWLSPFDARGPNWKADMPVIAITRPGAVFERAPDILIETEIPGSDGHSEIFSDRFQALVAAPPVPGSAHPSPGAILERMLGHMEARAA